MEFYEGQRVKVKHVDNDILLGFISAINTNESDSVLVLHKVEIWPQGDPADKTRLPGVQRFQASEISDIEILPESEQKKKTTPRSSRKEEQVIGHKCSGLKHLKNMVQMDPERLVLGKTKKSVDITPTNDEHDILIPKKFIRDNPTDHSEENNAGKSYVTNEFTVLTQLDKIFNEAIKFILGHSVIGLAVEGINIGREGKLCWIQVVVDKVVFLFDFINLGEEALKHGLQEIIESAAILKVIHDSRLVSDMFYHQFKIEMMNIFDTQVAHVLAYQAFNHKDLPRYVPGLASCLYEHLDLPNEQVHVMRIREQARTEDQEIWAVRPTSLWVLDAACKHVKHLLDLRMVLMEKMMVEFIAGVEIYLTYVRNASDKEAKECHSKRHLLPLAFQHLNRYVSTVQRRMQHNLKQPKTTLRRLDPYGFRENCTRVIDPQVIASKDSPWHGNHSKIKVNTKLLKQQKSVSYGPKKDKKGSQNEQLSFELDKSDHCNQKSDGESRNKISVVNSTDENFNSMSQLDDFGKKQFPLKDVKGVDSLKGFKFIPAGFMSGQHAFVKSEKNSHEIENMSSVTEPDVELDYGEIPTPKTLDRACSKNVLSFSSVLQSSLKKTQNEVFAIDYTKNGTPCNDRVSDLDKAEKNNLHTIKFNPQPFLPENEGLSSSVHSIQLKSLKCQVSDSFNEKTKEASRKSQCYTNLKELLCQLKSKS